MIPIGWLAVYEDGAGGERILRSKDGLSPRDLPAARCLGVRTFYKETIRIDDGLPIHYSDIWVGWDWVVFYEDGPEVWRTRNSHTDNGEGKEGIEIADDRWGRVLAERFLNNDDNRVGQW